MLHLGISEGVRTKHGQKRAKSGAGEIPLVLVPLAMGGGACRNKKKGGRLALSYAHTFALKNAAAAAA